MTLRRRLVLSLLCLAVLLGVEAAWTTYLNRQVASDLEEALGGALKASDRAVERSLALAWVKTSTQELVTETYRQAQAGGDLAHAPSLEAVRGELVAGLDRLERALVLQGLADRDAGANPLQAAFRQEFSLFRLQVDRLLELSRQSPGEAHAFLNTTLEPQARDRLRPLIENRRQAAEEELLERARRIAEGSRSTARLVVAVNAVTLLLAVGVGLSLLRSTSRKVDRLVAAATAIGQGRLDTRIPEASADELGFLAVTFNRMAEELAQSTISRSDLNNILESMPGALFILDGEMRVQKANQGALALLATTAEGIHGRPLADFCSAGPFALPDQLKLLPGERLKMEGTLFGDDNQRTTVLLSFSPLQGSGSESSSFVCVAHDISERKRAEVSLRGLLAEKDVLLREVHHRVKNNLQVVSSLLDLQSGARQSPDLRLLLAESRNRIRCMALIHEQLCRTSSRGRVDLATYFRELTDALATSQGRRAERVQVKLEVHDVSLDLDQAVAGGLIVNELVSNSFEHAFPDGERGEIRLSFRLRADGWYELVVADNGCGMPAEAGATEGSLGLTLVEALVSQLGGSLETESLAGTKTRITFPLGAESQSHAA